MLIRKHRFGPGPVTLIHLGDGEHTGDGIAKIHRPAEAKIHAGRQPTDLPAHFRDHSSNQQTMTDLALQVLRLREFIAVMDRILIATDLAEVEGIPVTRTRLLLLLLLALTIAVAIKIVGVLLITALLIIPAATARFWSTTPEQMVFFAGFFGSTAVICGLALSYFVDTPAGPSIVVSASGMFLMSMLFSKQNV